VEVGGESVHHTAGGGRKDDDDWRDLHFRVSGWQVCRLWVYELREDLPRCVQRGQAASRLNLHTNLMRPPRGFAPAQFVNTDRYRADSVPVLVEFPSLML